jgi:hypothetical protein
VRISMFATFISVQIGERIRQSEHLFTSAASMDVAFGMIRAARVIFICFLVDLSNLLLFNTPRHLWNSSWTL